MVTLAAMVISLYVFISAIVPVVTVLFVICFPLLLVLIHASTRLRNIRNRISNQLERVYFKKSLMTFLLKALDLVDGE